MKGNTSLQVYSQPSTYAIAIFFLIVNFDSNNNQCHVVNIKISDMNLVTFLDEALSAMCMCWDLPRSDATTRVTAI